MSTLLKTSKERVLAMTNDLSIVHIVPGMALCSSDGMVITFYTHTFVCRPRTADVFQEAFKPRESIC